MRNLLISHIHFPHTPELDLNKWLDGPLPGATFASSTPIFRAYDQINRKLNLSWTLMFSIPLHARYMKVQPHAPILSLKRPALPNQ